MKKLITCRVDVTLLLIDCPGNPPHVNVWHFARRIRLSGCLGFGYELEQSALMTSLSLTHPMRQPGIDLQRRVLDRLAEGIAGTLTGQT
jgi:hypothetical protein